jgi:dTDP-4-dehydrorhamnose reductase
MSPVEIWGGVECTVVRIKNSVHDQLKISGHENRLEDLNLFSDLGIKTIRYPLLWEKYLDDEEHFFQLNDQRLNKLQELEITPIAGLLHHGSGPVVTNIYDPGFPESLAAYAFKIAERYPWISYYTPVNEPLTTARFSGLYGIWYPHKRDGHSFARIFLNELKGIVLSMKAIRCINPDAKLIQTEDICKIHSTEPLKYQANFENHRRWLTYDILTGNFNAEHPLWSYFVNLGIPENELEFFITNSIKPSVCGFNYYVTSERYLDHRKSLYPKRYHGGNGIQRYADIEAVRAELSTHINAAELLREAWDRYQLPIALTEVHLACTREEQLRWFHEAHQTALKLKAEGVDFRAITAWSFLGSFAWNSLLRKKNNHYESGVFDIRSGNPRATALAGMIKTINSGKMYDSHLLEVPGWWRRNNRFVYASANEKNLTNEDKSKNYDHVLPLLIVGANGSLGGAFAKICETRGIIYHIVKRSQLDITSKESIQNILNVRKPWAIINAAGFSDIDEAEMDPQLCFRENTLGPAVLAEICKAENIKLVTFSTDQVFNGKKGKPYIENDRTAPLNTYGESKKMAEEQVLAINPRALIIRSSSFFNPWNEGDTLARILHSSITPNQSHYLASDIIISPTYIPDLVNTALDLLIDEESGIWHLSSQEEISYFDFTKLALNLAGLSHTHISSVPSVKLKYKAERPSYSVLKSSQGISLPPLYHALHRYLNELQLTGK